MARADAAMPGSALTNAARSALSWQLGGGKQLALLGGSKQLAPPLIASAAAACSPLRGTLVRVRVRVEVRVRVRVRVG